MVATLAPSTHARAAAAAGPPQPYVVALDAGHGGSPDNAHPDQPFDPGGVGPNGLLEKDVALDVVRRARTLLQQDLVDVVLTRDSDVYLDIAPRMATANDAHAGLFVSVHMNSFADTTVHGSVVLYNNETSHPFASTMEAALSRRLGPLGIPDDGVILRDNLWIHAQMPVVTIEPLYLSNPAEAALAAQDSTRQSIAAAVRDAVEAQDPAVLARRAQIIAWRVAHRDHPTAAAAAVAPGGAPPGGSFGATLLRWTAVVALLAAAVRWRRPLGRLSRVVARVGVAAGAAAGARAGPVLAARLERWTGGRISVEGSWRRRRRVARRRALLARSRIAASRPRSVYDELY